MVDRKEGGNREGGISMIECQDGHTFPEQRRFIQLVLVKCNNVCIFIHLPSLPCSRTP